MRAQRAECVVLYPHYIALLLFPTGILTGNLAIASAVAIVAVALRVQARTVRARRPIGTRRSGHLLPAAVVAALQLRRLLVGAGKAIRSPIADARQLEQLQIVGGFVDLAAKIAVLQVEEEDFVFLAAAGAASICCRLSFCRLQAGGLLCRCGCHGVCLWVRGRLYYKPDKLAD